jgi:2-succinyl-5-enolpyruvyl-6-hydroxy-3-cyclohexene-1-carboxylate synthase
MNKRILIVVGENRGVDIDTTALRDFAKTYGVVIYANQLSNICNDYTVYGNRLMSWISQDEFDETYCPDILITVGGQTGDYPIYHKLAETKKSYEHWRISIGGEIVDTYDHLTKVFECDYDEFFKDAKYGNGDTSYLTVWKEAIEAQRVDAELPLSNAYLAQQLYRTIPNGSIVNFAILNSLRVWNLFPLERRCRCFSNVAAFGIDGCMSTFMGQSTQTDSLCFLIIGDLSFYYDMNSLGLRQIGRNVRILLVNNYGGMEFKYASTSESRKKIDQYIAAGGHFKNAKGWATTCGFEYFQIKTKNEFNIIREKLLSPSEKSMVVEVFIDEQDENDAMKILKQYNIHDKRSFTDNVVERLKRKIRKVF